MCEGASREQQKRMEASNATKALGAQNNGAHMFVALNDFPPPDIEKAWRDCLYQVECPPSYCCPEFFLEPSWLGKRPFAILAVNRGFVVGVLTGLHEGNQVLSGLQSRPQICVDATADFHATLESL